MLPNFQRDFNAILEKNEISQDIVYVQYSDGTKTPMKAVLMGREFETKEEEGRMVLDSLTVFLTLPFMPSKYDYIQILDNDNNVEDTYIVFSWVKQSSRYKLQVKNDVRSTNHHSKGRFR